ncbi:MAG: hypothetical protein INR71_08865 [Terriglobus roseus]|nr:hypothetical protein [Terriglobus roseus]
MPQKIDFYRQPIEPEPAKQQQPQQAISSAAAILEAAAARARASAKKVTSIYGSVSIADVLANIAAALRENDEAARVVLTESDLKFTGLADSEDHTKLKQIGDFEVEIQLKGADEAVKRVVRVLPLAGAG